MEMALCSAEGNGRVAGSTGMHEKASTRNGGVCAMAEAVRGDNGCSVNALATNAIHLETIFVPCIVGILFAMAAAYCAMLGY
jgi:hypothetical protein